MKRFKQLSILFILSTIFFSCEDFFEKPIDIGIEEHESRIAGTAVLGYGDDFRNSVLASVSKGVFDQSVSNQLLNNAMITLSGNNQEIIFDLTSEDGIYDYSNSINFIPEEEYVMTISSPNYETISAKQIYPEKVQIIDASINSNTFKIRLIDDLDEKNYYLLSLYAETADGASSQQIYLEPFGSLTTRSSFCYNCVNFTDETFNEEEFEIVVNHFIDVIEENERYRVHLYNLTEDFFRYDRSLLNLENGDGNPFVEPVILHRNFENGYGIFSLMNKTEYIFQ